jgi:hypothetical protein
MNVQSACRQLFNKQFSMFRETDFLMKWILMQVIEEGQINNKVLGQTHIFSGYSFGYANQPMMCYKYMA